MYNEHFGLDRLPFRITPDTRLFYTGGRRGDVLEALVYAVTSGEGIVKVVGEVGTGKTMLCRMLEERVPDNVRIAYLANPSLTPDDILQAIALELGLQVRPQASRLQVMHALHEELLRRHAANQRVVVLVEEAQSMPVDTLEEIRLLSNLETKNEKLLQIILFGQPELDANLARPEIRQLRDRITHGFRLTPLARHEVRAYLGFRLRASGYRGRDVFTDRAYRLIAQASEGLTRRVNVLADKAMLAAFAEGSHEVTGRHVKVAVRDSGLPFDRRGARGWSPLAVAAGATGLALLAAAGGWHLGPGPPQAPAAAAAQSSTVAASPQGSVAPPATAPDPAGEAATPARASGSGERPAAASRASETVVTASAGAAPIRGAAAAPAAPAPSSEDVSGSGVVPAPPFEGVPGTGIAAAPVSESARRSEPAPAPRSEGVPGSGAAPAPPPGAEPLQAAAPAPLREVAPAPEGVAPEAIAARPGAAPGAVDREAVASVANRIPAGPGVASPAAPPATADAPTAPPAATAPAASVREAAPAPGAMARGDVPPGPRPAPETVERGAAMTAMNRPPAARATGSPADASPAPAAPARSAASPATIPDALSGAEVLAQRLAVTRDWLKGVDAKHYSIQLLATDASQRHNLEAFLRERHRAGDIGEVYVYETVIRGRPWFGVLYGDFPSFSAARRALRALSEDLLRHQPFIRNISDVDAVG